VVVTRFHAEWNALFTNSKQELIVMLYLSYLLLSSAHAFSSRSSTERCDGPDVTSRADEFSWHP
jgi:hypothetical protein